MSRSRAPSSHRPRATMTDMRLKLGRPDLAQYVDRFDVPVAGEGDLSVTFLGVATLHVDDGSSAILTDGFFSRPGLFDVGVRRISPNLARIEACLERAGIGRLEAVLPGPHPLRPRAGLGRRRRPDGRDAGRWCVGRSDRCGSRARAGTHPRRRAGTAHVVRPLRDHHDRVGALPAGPLSRRHRRATRPLRPRPRPIGAGRRGRSSSATRPVGACSSRAVPGTSRER